LNSIISNYKHLHVLAAEWTFFGLLSVEYFATI